MNKKFIPIAFSGIIALTACGANNHMGNQDIFGANTGNTINVTNRANQLDVNDGNERQNVDIEHFGYVRHQKNSLGGRGNSYDFVAIDRERLADGISRLSTDLPNVNDVATLVTDEEVLVVYATDTNDRNLTADQVKKTAMSVVPRYYHVYVSDDTSLLRNVESYATLSSNSRNVDSLVDHLISRMLHSPQGERMSESENENGVNDYELNRKADSGFSPPQIKPVQDQNQNR